MRYRIKISHYATGRIGYTPYEKKWWGWERIGAEQSTRESALFFIDRDYGYYLDKKSVTVEFDYITKPE